MSKKETLLNKLLRKPSPKNFTVQELCTLMAKCGCQKFEGGRGSSIAFRHVNTNRVVQFDAPHPGKELYRYQIDKVIDFLKQVGEI